MRNEELIKALWCCGVECKCYGCPYENKTGINEKSKCIHMVLSDAADAIERLQADIAKKDSQLAEWKNAWRIANSLYKSAQAEIDEHRAYQHELVERIEQLKAELSELKQAEPTGPNEPKGDN